MHPLQSAGGVISSWPGRAHKWQQLCHTCPLLNQPGTNSLAGWKCCHACTLPSQLERQSLVDCKGHMSGSSCATHVPFPEEGTWWCHDAKQHHDVMRVMGAERPQFCSEFPFKGNIFFPLPKIWSLACQKNGLCRLMQKTMIQRLSFLQHLASKLPPIFSLSNYQVPTIIWLSTTASLPFLLVLASLPFISYVISCNLVCCQRRGNKFCQDAIPDCIWHWSSRLLLSNKQKKQAILQFLVYISSKKVLELIESIILLFQPGLQSLPRRSGHPDVQL